MTYSFNLAKIPVSTQWSYFHEFDVENRATGDVGMLTERCRCRQGTSSARSALGQKPTSRSASSVYLEPEADMRSGDRQRCRLGFNIPASMVVCSIPEVRH